MRHYRASACLHRLEPEHGFRRHPLVRLGGRAAKAGLQLVAGVPALVSGRPDGWVHATLSGARALGGATAWLSPSMGRGLVGCGKVGTNAEGQG